MGTTYQLPGELAPSLVERALALLADLSPAVPPSLTPDRIHHRAVCIVCHQTGKLGGHHAEDGRVEWVHKACHRKLHQRGRLSRSELERIHQRERSVIAC
ncbi:MAG: hypothetical protein M3P04_08310 [Actinomycetota bacterium]|nr:hypothetical protein [Actinomycetota bacterium]